jgi:hypothetical protein
LIVAASALSALLSGSDRRESIALTIAHAGWIDCAGG